MDTNDVTEGIIASLTTNKSDTAFQLEGYVTQIITECQNKCGNEFDSPIILMVDGNTEIQANTVCPDCVALNEDDDNEGETSDEVSAHEQSA